MKINAMTRGLTLTVCMALLGQSIWAAPKTHTPKAGSKERKAILDALRVPVSKSNRKKVIFIVDDLTVSQGWAYVSAGTVDSKGKPVGPPFTSTIQAALHKTNKKWRVLDWSYATDVISLDWEKKYPKAPKRIWPQNR